MALPGPLPLFLFGHSVGLFVTRDFLMPGALEGFQIPFLLWVVYDLIYL